MTHFPNNGICNSNTYFVMKKSQEENSKTDINIWNWISKYNG